MKVSRWGGALLWVCLPGLILLWGCRRSNPSTFDSNLPPETYIPYAPAESTLAYYRVHLYWNGVDPDGEVDHFEYAVTDSNKIPGEDTPGFSGFFRTTRTDSTFQLEANNPQILGHRFYVRAVDNENKVDPTPAWTYFIAHDFNFPNVTFTRSLGTWVDRDGTTHRITLKSNNQFSPTDTIGVGGNISLAWTGHDVDEGGSVVGYEYRASTSTSFTGGTLADTAMAESFDPAVTGAASYFSGREVIQIRAIDDAGAKTQPDSIRSVVVNFSPVTWIAVQGADGKPVRSQVFTDADNGRTWPSGTTLAGLRLRHVRFTFTGFDDPRDKVIDPARPSGIKSTYSYRILREGGGQAYKPITGQPYPALNTFDIQSLNLTVGNWTFLVRSEDLLARQGQPDTILVHIGYTPYFTSVTYTDGQGQEQPLWIPPTQGTGHDTVTVTIPRNPDGSYPNFRMTVLASDHHVAPSEGTPPNPLDPNPVVEDEPGQVEEYRIRLNGASSGFEPVPEGNPEVHVFQVSPAGGADVIHAGINRAELSAKDNEGKTKGLTVAFKVILGQ